MGIMLENVIEISKDQLLGKVQEMCFNKYRFATASCVDLGEGKVEVIYHFDKDLELVNFKIIVNKDEELSSISGIYFCALLVENEMKELFGLNIVNIVIDYSGHLLLTDDAPSSPMLKNQIVIEKREGK
jgi:ech hydrogenase subunit D